MRFTRISAFALACLLAACGPASNGPDESHLAVAEPDDVLYPPLPDGLTTRAEYALSPSSERFRAGLWHGDSVLVAHLSERIQSVGQARLDSTRRVLDTLVFRRGTLVGGITLADDIGAGCRIDDDTDLSNGLVARLPRLAFELDETCVFERLGAPAEAWLADTTAGRFVPVADLTRIECYRGACP